MRKKKHKGGDCGSDGERDDLSLHPLDMDEALAGFLATDPEKLKEAERRKRKKRDANDEEEDA